MSTTCIAISNMSGIVCASDTDYTIYQLSKTYPLAVAVNSYSPKKKKKIINDYKSLGEPKEKENFEDYAMDFEKYLSTIQVLGDITELTTEDSNIFFMGYGKEDLFPQTYDTYVCINNGKWGFDSNQTDIYKISHANFAHINLLGNLDSVSALIWGASSEVNNMIIENHVKTFNVYKERVLNRFKGTEFEQFVTKKLNEYDAKEDIKQRISEAVDKTFSCALDGIETFSIEDMVTAAEYIVDAEVRLDHLSSGCKTPLKTTREIAVITRVEGLTWIKHSIYAL